MLWPFCQNSYKVGPLVWSCPFHRIPSIDGGCVCPYRSSSPRRPPSCASLWPPPRQEPSLLLPRVLFSLGILFLQLCLLSEKIDSSGGGQGIKAGSYSTAYRRLSIHPARLATTLAVAVAFLNTNCYKEKSEYRTLGSDIGHLFDAGSLS